MGGRIREMGWESKSPVRSNMAAALLDSLMSVPRRLPACKDTDIAVVGAGLAGLVVR